MPRFPSPPGPARVLMMVGNDIRHDTRVLKTALALADGGLDVTILGYASSGHREEKRLGPVSIVRVPVAWRLRDRRARRAAASQQRAWRFGSDPADKRLVQLRANLRAREAAELGGWGRVLRAKAASTQRHLTRVRDGLDRQAARLQTRGRGAAHRWLTQRPTGARWRAVLPEIDDYELAFAPVIDGLDWDVIHAHDVHLIGVASRAVARRRASGRPARWVYDAHEFVAGLSTYPARPARKVGAYLDLEREYVRDADAVVTVTEPLARELRSRYGLPAMPAVVMNSPVLHEGSVPVDVGVRQACGLEPGVPLLVYSGGVTVARGVDTAVAALPQLPGVHLAVVCVPHREVGPAAALAAQAQALGVADRLHLLDPVAPDQVSAFIASADVGIIPLRHFGSHQVALANKLFEYLYAGLPCLVSDCRAQAEFVRAHGVGAVHAAGDTASFAAAAQQVLMRAQTFHAAIAASPDLLEPFAWQQQERALRDAYRDLLGPEQVTEPVTSSSLHGLAERPADRADRPPVVGVGPANMAGQGWEWAKALERNVPGLRTHVMVVDRDLPLLFPADEVVPARTYTGDARWAQTFEARALRDWTHALLEAGRPVFGVRHGRDFRGDAEVLRAVGIRVGLLMHGSEARNPSRHRTLTPWSPFTDPDEELTARLQTQWDALHPTIAAFAERGEGPLFCSTPELLGDVPGSVWLPVVVDPDAADPTRAVPLLARDVPVVLHAPSRASLKGTAFVHEAVAPLVAEGLIDFQHIEGIPPEQMPDRIAQADILLDQFTLGIYGVLAVQGLAAGRVVVGHVMDLVRRHCRDATGRDLPVVEADPATLGQVLRGLLADREAATATVAPGLEYAREVHDGRMSARVLGQALGLAVPGTS